MKSFLSFLLGEKKQTASVAKERLQLILAHERSGRSAAEPDYLQDLQRDLIAVISKYIKIDIKDIKVNLDRHGNLEVLEVNSPTRVSQQHPAGSHRQAGFIDHAAHNKTRMHAGNTFDAGDFVEQQILVMVHVAYDHFELVIGVLSGNQEAFQNLG